MSDVRTEPGADPIIVESHYPVPRERVYEAWTDPEQVKQWFGSQSGSLHEAAIDLRTGGRWRFIEQAGESGWTGFEGQYLEIVPNELLIFTWTKVTERSNGPPNAGSRQSSPYSRVEIRFADTSDGTSMRIVHSNLDPDARIGFRTGWAIGTASLAACLSSRNAATAGPQKAVK